MHIKFFGLIPPSCKKLFVWDSGPFQSCMEMLIHWFIVAGIILLGCSFIFCLMKVFGVLRVCNVLSAFGVWQAPVPLRLAGTWALISEVFSVLQPPLCFFGSLLFVPGTDVGSYAQCVDILQVFLPVVSIVCSVSCVPALKDGLFSTFTLPCCHAAHTRSVCLHSEKEKS